MAFVRLAFFPGGTAEHYATLARELGSGQVPAGRLAFAAGPVDGGWQVVQIWSSKPELDAFNQAVFLPAMLRLAGAGFPAAPTVVDFEPVDLSVPTSSG